MASCMSNNPFEFFRSTLNPNFDLVDFLQQALPELVQVQQLIAESLRSGGSYEDGKSTIHSEKDKFQVKLDVKSYKPEEVSVKVSEDSVIVEGRHGEKEVEHGSISRQFVRRFSLPKDFDINKVDTKMSSNGVLTITAPKMAAAEKYTIIPVIHLDRQSGDEKIGEEKEND